MALTNVMEVEPFPTVTFPCRIGTPELSGHEFELDFTGDIKVVKATQSKKLELCRYTWEALPQ